jgi:hypothetical protein
VLQNRINETHSWLNGKRISPYAGVTDEDDTTTADEFITGFVKTQAYNSIIEPLWGLIY